MKRICRWSWVCVIAAFMLMVISPSAAEAGRWRRHVHVVHAAPVYVAPVRVYAPVVRVAPGPVIHHHYRAPVHVVTPGVRVHVSGFGGVSVNIGGWYGH